MKRESGANPGQSRCCEAPRRLRTSQPLVRTDREGFGNRSQSEDLPDRFDVGEPRGQGIRFRLQIASAARASFIFMLLFPPRQSANKFGSALGLTKRSNCILRLFAAIRCAVRTHRPPRFRTGRIRGNRLRIPSYSGTANPLPRTAPAGRAPQRIEATGEFLKTNL